MGVPARLAVPAVLAALCLAGAAQARTHAQPDVDKLPPTRIQDLQYGDVLFYYFQGDDFEALKRLSAYEHWNQLKHHEADARLLEAGLYLSLGLYQEAGTRFAKLLTEDVPAGVRDRAWFHLGEIRYARDELEGAVQALRQVHGTLSAQDDAERVHLLANALVRQGHYDDAITLLEGFNGPPVWVAYARFNLGVALVRAKRLPEADRFLTTVGTLAASQEELLALRDRANLALGFAWLQAGQPDSARVPLARVRLNGPYSNKALLGMGWADAALKDYQGALAPWTELRKRSLLDSAVQESWLALPYAYGKLDSGSQAAADYEAALTTFAAEGRRLDESIISIRSGRMIDTLLKGDKVSRMGWFWQLPSLPDVPESRYLYPILAGHDFQEGLKNYRDLRYLKSTLDEWEADSSAFTDMIDARERADARRLPQARQMLASGTVEGMQQRRQALAAHLDAVESQHEVAALATPEEHQQWQQVQALDQALAGQPASEDTAALKERLRLVKGVLQYQLDGTFKERMWQQRRTLKDVDQSLAEAQRRWFALRETLDSAPEDTRAFAARLAALQQRITQLQARMLSTEDRQGDYLQRLTVVQLREQKERLAAYEAQARFALANLYDKSAETPGPKPAPAPAEPAQ